MVYKEMKFMIFLAQNGLNIHNHWQWRFAIMGTPQLSTEP